MQKILIVDDEKIMLKVASKMLSKEYAVVCANSGAEAIELFDREKPDLVLSDLLMPGMDGYELHRQLQLRSVEPVPVVFMTADESEESESKVLKVGAADYIRKPLRADVLLKRVKNVLDRINEIQGLTEAASLDMMTGLLNKTATEREIAKVCVNEQGVLMLLDLDSFKLVNDLHGHAMGDKLLVRFAELIKSIIRSTDIAGRIGGDEFIAFCGGVHDEKVVASKAQLLNSHLLLSAKRFMGADMKIPLGVSVGAVFVPDEGTDFAILKEKADKALYKVKHSGNHGCAFFGTDTDSSERKSVSQTQMILSERGRSESALFVDFDKFKAIYRLAARLNETSKISFQFLEMTLDTTNENLRGEFLEVLIKNLRRGDCVTQYGHDQFLALLSDIKAEDVETVRQKILSTWSIQGVDVSITGKSL